MGNDSVWYFTGAKLFPNVKGCGYPPMLNCSIFYRQYANIGQNFSCYYSKVDPGIVISDLDMWQVSVLAVALVFPSRVRESVFSPRIPVVLRIAMASGEVTWPVTRSPGYSQRFASRYASRASHARVL